MTICNIIRLLVLFLFIAPSGLSGQESTHLIQPLKQDTIKQAILMPEQITEQSLPIGSMEEYVRLNQAPPWEKVYLHLDRPNYMLGDTIWFKAYSWFGYDQIPDTTSGILYVDLLNSENRVKLKRKVLIQNGTSQGDFNLDTTISPGRYTLRAYTRWMQNLNTGEPFYQTVIISPTSQNFQVECTPFILKHPGNDSLKVSFRFFEIDQTGDLKNSFSHKVDYSLKIGDQLIHSDQVLAENTKEQFFKCRLSAINENDSVAVFELSIRDNRLTFKKQFRIPLQESIDLQFFPEGGKLVNGLESKIAFKAIGIDGLSREVKGVIETGGGEVVANFESSHKGMGAFTLKPEAKKEYFAHLMYNNRNYLIPLPPALEEGCTMSVSFTGIDNIPYLTIKQSPIEGNTQKFIIGGAYGKIWFSALVKLTKDSCRFRIPLELLPEGVCRLTVLDNDYYPECERLIYVNKYQRFKIEVEPDSSFYGTRSKVTLLIKTTMSDGTPVQTNLSLAVVDKELITRGEEVNGICEYKLLESELKGHIEDAGLYFKDDSCTDYSALDLLLLTQGYRKFVPGNMKPDELKFQPERSFDISGTIKFSGSKSREKKFNYRDINLTLMCWSVGMYLDQCNPDSLGRFRFQTPLLFGKSHSLLQATTPKGKPFYGEISLDESVNPPQFNPPLFANYNITPPTVDYIHQLQAVKKTETSKTPWAGTMSISLGEVTVTAKAKNWYRNYEKEALKIANLDSLDPTGNRYKNIYELLIGEFGAKEHTIMPGMIKTILLPCVSIGSSDWFPIYVINGKTYFDAAERGEIFIAMLNNLSVLNVNEIKRLMVLPPGNIASYYADGVLRTEIRQSLVVIETYSDNSFRGDPLGIKTFILDGLDAPRVFYSPRYEGPSRKNPIYDSRATLLWEPSIRTDTNGQAKIEFFTSDRQTSLEVVVNGIEVISGYPGYGKVQINSALK